MLKEKHFEEALRHSLEAGARLGLDQSDQRTHIVEAMLAEARRLFAAGTESKETKAVLHLLERIFAVQSPCPEASFWQGLCHIRESKSELAMQSLARARAGKVVADGDAPESLVLRGQGLLEILVELRDEAALVEQGERFPSACRARLSAT